MVTIIIGNSILHNNIIPVRKTIHRNVVKNEFKKNNFPAGIVNGMFYKYTQEKTHWNRASFFSSSV